MPKPLKDWLYLRKALDVGIVGLERYRFQVPPQNGVIIRSNSWYFFRFFSLVVRICAGSKHVWESLQWLSDPKWNVDCLSREGTDPHPYGDSPRRCKFEFQHVFLFNTDLSDLSWNLINYKKKSSDIRHSEKLIPVQVSSETSNGSSWRLDYF